MEEEKEAEKKGRLTKKQEQQRLTFQTVMGPSDFMRGGVLNAVVKLVQYFLNSIQITHDAPIATCSGR